MNLIDFQISEMQKILLLICKSRESENRDKSFSYDNSRSNTKHEITLTSVFLIEQLISCISELVFISLHL